MPCVVYFYYGFGWLVVLCWCNVAWFLGGGFVGYVAWEDLYSGFDCCCGQGG